MLKLGGQADDAFGTVALEIDGVNGTSLSDIVAPDVATERYAASTNVDFAMDPLVEGSYYVTAAQGTGDAEEASIGIR